MKNLYKLLIGVLALSTVTSCDDYLEVDHYDILPADFMFKTEENVLSGLNGLYDTFYTDQHGSGDDETWDSSLRYLLPTILRWTVRLPVGMRMAASCLETDKGSWRLHGG